MRADGAAAIFEGTAERLEFRWSVLDAAEGTLVPTLASFPEYPLGLPDPHTIVRFRVERVYKGNLGDEVEVGTGLGGGDCGARFIPGLKYLVYLYTSKTRDFIVTICSPGGPVDSRQLAPELRYLRAARPTHSDLLPYKPRVAWTAQEVAQEDRERKRYYEEYQQTLTRTTGKICGKVVYQGPRGKDAGTLSFLSISGYLAGEVPSATVNDDGSFCSEPLYPGKYYLNFFSTWDGNTRSSLYYPDVSDRAKARPVEVIASQIDSTVLFKVAPQKTYSVVGFISTNDKSGLNDVSVALFRVDGVPRLDFYRTPVDFDGSLPLPKTKYFAIHGVLPGRYVAYVSGPGQGWFTKKTKFTVDSHGKMVFVQLVRRK